jgi:hypothetical protein
MPISRIRLNIVFSFSERSTCIWFDCTT